MHKLGTNVTNSREGDRVFGFSISSHTNLLPDLGRLQQYAILRADVIAHIRPGLEDEQVVTLPTKLVTSWQTLFTPSGFNLAPPLPPSTNDLTSITLVILAAGSNIGKLTIQLAHLAGIGKIIAVASECHHSTLLHIGTTHFFNRHVPEPYLVASIYSIILDDANDDDDENEGFQYLDDENEGFQYLFNCSNTNTDFVFATSLSKCRTSILRTTHPISPAQREILSCERPLCHAEQTYGANENLHPHARQFWPPVPTWLKEGVFFPTTPFRVIDGLDRAGEINAALDGYREGVTMAGRSGL